MDESKNKYKTGYILKKKSHAYLCKKLLEKKDRFLMKTGQFNRGWDSQQ